MRYLPLSDADRAAMLARIGAASVEDLFVDVPASARLKGPIAGLAPHQGEIAVERAFRTMAAENLSPSVAPCFLGAGVYRHHIPASVDALVQRGEFLTSYTPYQPEVSQGTLQALFEFQTQVALLMGMEVANASLYDGSTGAAEAVAMALRLTKRPNALLSGGLHPHYRAVIETQGRLTGGTVQALPADPNAREDIAAAISDETACVVVQYPGFFGQIPDLAAIGAAAHAKGALLVVVVTEIVALGLLPAPGDFGADIVVAEGQSLGVPMSFGGPHVGLFATREKFIRQMPGRVCGQTVDADGRRGFVLTLSTREQHIRREKATSNICTNSGLCALAFSIHLSLLGETGLKSLARLNHEAAIKTADALSALPGVQVLNTSFFNEFTIRLPQPAEGVVAKLAASGVLGGVPVARLYPGRADLADLLLVAATELNDDDEIAALTQALREALR